MTSDEILRKWDCCSLLKVEMLRTDDLKRILLVIVEVVTICREKKELGGGGVEVEVGVELR